jgi:hypothetical protein
VAVRYGAPGKVEARSWVTWDELPGPWLPTHDPEEGDQRERAADECKGVRPAHRSAPPRTEEAAEGETEDGRQQEPNGQDLEGEEHSGELQPDDERPERGQERPAAHRPLARSHGVGAGDEGGGARGEGEEAHHPPAMS